MPPLVIRERQQGSAINNSMTEEFKEDGLLFLFQFKEDGLLFCILVKLLGLGFVFNLIHVLVYIDILKQ